MVLDDEGRYPINVNKDIELQESPIPFTGQMVEGTIVNVSIHGKSTRVWEPSSAEHPMIKAMKAKTGYGFRVRTSLIDERATFEREMKADMCSQLRKVY